MMSVIYSNGSEKICKHICVYNTCVYYAHTHTHTHTYTHIHTPHRKRDRMRKQNGVKCKQLMNGVGKGW